MIHFSRLLLPAACILPLLSMAPGLLAQVPTGAVIILQGPPNPFGFDSYAIADPAGGGATVLPLQTSPLLFAETNALSVDPANANQVFLLNDANGFDPGIKLAPIGSMARTIGMASGQQFTQVGGTAMVVGSSRVFTLRAGGIVEATPKVGGAPFQLLQLTNAIDIALAEPFLYVACNDPAQPAPLVEFSLLTGAQRVVGNYPDVRCLAKSRTSNELAVGTGSGLVLELDLATGNVTNSFVAGFGFLRALEYTAQSDLVFALDSGGLGFTVWSQLATAPIFTGNDGFKDLAVAIATTASVVEFGEGCGVAAQAGWDAVGLPTPGNAQFGLQIQNAPVTAPLALFLGGSRYQSSVLTAPLPFDLQAFGAGGCSLLTDPLVPLVQVTNGLGSATQTIPIPAGPQLLGIEYQAQCLVLDAGVQPLGLATSAGVAFRVN